MVASHLAAEGFEVIGRNVRVGRLELDLIARRGTLIVFCEVRSRSSDARVAPHQTLTPRKVQLVRDAARRWLRDNPPGARVEVRLDAASVVFEGDDHRLDYFPGAL